MNARSEDARGLVVAPQAEAAYEGARVLADGGNAADATVTAALVQGVVDPHRCGLGGFGCATVLFPEHGGALSIDFHGRAGSLARAEQWESIYEGAAPDGFGYVLRGKVNDVGHAAITVPGLVSGLGELHQRFGSLPWSDLVLRAVPYADDGFLVPPALADFWIRPGLHGRVSTRDRLSATEAGRRIALHADGRTYAAGETFRQTDLARTYRRLAEEGAESYYRGSIAREILTEFQAGGALVTADDLESYRPDVRAPLRGTYRDCNVLTTPLPGGGVALLQALAMLEEVDVGALLHNSADYIDAVAPVCRAVSGDRLAHHGDPRFDGLTDAELLSPEYIASLRPQAPTPSGADSESTTQLSVVDGHGNAVSFSHSLGYGSGVFCPGLGFMFNNCMSAFDPRPGFRNSIAAGKARSTAVAETIVLAGGQPLLILGSPGAARITAGILQVILDVVDLGMTAAEAVVHPRFDAFGDRRLLLESRFPPPLVAELRRRGWDVHQSAKSFGLIGRVYAIQLDPTGRFPPIAGVDPGEPGAAFRS